MMRLGQALFLWLFLVVPAGTMAQNTDSVLAVFNNTQLADTTRLSAIHELAWQMVFVDPAKAEVYVKKELSLAKKTGNTYFESRAYNTLGCAYHMMGKYNIALQYHTLALQLRQKNNDQKGVAASLSNIGSEYLSLSDYPKALDYYFQSLKIEEKLGNQEGIAQTYTNLGLIYDHIAEGSGLKRDYDRALAYYTKSLAITEKTGNKHISAATLGNIGNRYEELHELRKAYDYQTKAVQYYLQSGDAQGAASTYGNIGNIIQDMGDKELLELGIAPINRYDTTRAYYTRCYQMMAALGEPNGMALSLSNMGWINVVQKKYKEAIHYLEQAVEMSREIGDIDGEKESHELLYIAYKALNQPTKSLEHYEQYILLRDSIYKEESMKDLTRKELAFEYEAKVTADSLKTAQERVLMNLKFDQERTTRYYLFAGLALVVVFALFMVSRFRITQKQKSIIQAQKVVVEEQNKKVSHQKELLEEKNKEVLDSIHYARRLQEAILPPSALWNQYLPKSFIYYKPKDIVAGDFYWMEVVKSNTHTQVLFAAADSTGHGVPGALVSVVCSNALNRAVKEFHLTVPGQILDKVRELVMETFRSENPDTEVKDGMDISLISIAFERSNVQTFEPSNSQTIKLEWAGANNPLWIYRKGSTEINELHPDKQPIGYHHVQKNFTTHQVSLQAGDRLFLFTDGYADQFGGDKGKKFKYSNLKSLMLSMGHQPLSLFPDKLEHTLNTWKGDLEQLDDICVLGVEL